MASRMAQMVEHLPSKCEALSSNPSTEEKEERGNERKRQRGRQSFEQGSDLKKSLLWCLNCISRIVDRKVNARRLRNCLGFFFFF
jgi:hypothetical protein